jgi:hypothetical protein
MPEELEPYKPIILITILSLIVLFNIYYFIFSGWGLVTIHVHEVPIDKVVKSIERQGWVKILSNVDPSTNVTMDVDQVPVCEALETLTQCGTNDKGQPVRCQWKLTWFAGPSRADVSQGMDIFTSGGDFRQNHWHRYGSNTMTQAIFNDDDPVPDPTAQTWNVTDSKTDLKGYLEATVQASDVQVYAPDDWNPPLSSPGVYASYSVSSGVSGLIKHAGGTYQVLYTLAGPRRRPQGTNDGPPPGPRPENGGGDWAGRNDPTLLWARLTNLAKGLPTAEARTNALNRIQEEQTFMQSIQNLPEDQKRQQMMQHMADNAGNHGGRSSPESRQARYSAMIATKASALGIGPSNNNGGLTSAPAPTK